MRKFFDFIKKRDEYGHPVGMTFKGETTYQTLRGGVISIGVNVYLMYYLITMFMPVHLGEISNFQPQIRFIDIKKEIYNPFENGFSFAVGFNQTLDPQIATLSLTYNEKIWPVNGTENRTKIDFPMRPCA